MFITPSDHEESLFPDRKKNRSEPHSERFSYFFLIIALIGIGITLLLGMV